MTNVLIVENMWNAADESIKMLEKIANVEMLRGDYVAVGVTPAVTEDELVEKVEDVDAIIVRWAPITRKVLENAKRLKVIVVHGASYANVDVREATKKGVLVSFLPLDFGKDVPEFTFALILASSKKLFKAGEHFKSGNFLAMRQPTLVPMRLEDKTLGVIGLGRIGTRVARLAKAFGMQVLAYDPYITKDRADIVGADLVELQTLLEKSDIITIHCTITPPFGNHPNYHMIGEKELKRMKKTAVLVNTARGPIVDQEALYRALREGWITGAALDVFEKEPPDPSDPLFELKNVIVTPHIASITYESTTGMGFEVVKEAISALEGNVTGNLVNKEVLEISKKRKT